MKVKDLMSTSIICSKMDTPLHILAKQMKRENVGILPICSDSGHILGIVTDRDIVIRGIEKSTFEKSANPDIYLVTAKDIMSTNIISVSPNASTHDASILMAQHQVRRLLVVENGKLVGVLAIADIARKKLYIDEAGDALSAISKLNGFQ